MMWGVHRLLWFVCGGCFLVACSGDETWRPDDASLGLEKWRLTLICSPNGLGDNGYNDKIFEGVCRFLDVYGDEVEFHLKTPLLCRITRIGWRSRRKRGRTTCWCWPEANTVIFPP